MVARRGCADVRVVIRYTCDDKDDRVTLDGGGRMQEFSCTNGWRAAWRLATLCALAGVVACGASPTGGPDPARSTFFQSTLVDGGRLPFEILLPNMLRPMYLTSAKLVPMDLGRTTDTRIFDDRGGSGSVGGNGRDTTVSTGRMSDIRVFASTPGGATPQTDSIAVDVVRVGDILYITRPHPDPTRNRTDTAFYQSGVLVRKISYWRDLTEAPQGRTLTYTTVR